MTLLPWLRLVRAGTLFSPAADVVAGICLAGQPWSGAAVAAVLASVCLYAAGMVLNDHADRAEDAVVRPERPLPRGEITPNAALAAGLLLLAAGVLLSPAPHWHGAIALLVVLYDYALKRYGPAAAIAMGTLRGMNLLAGAIALGAAPTQFHQVAALVYALYIAAVTVLGGYEDARNVKPKAILGVQFAAVLAAGLVLLGLPVRWPALLGGVAVLLFAARARRIGTWDRAAIRGSMTWLLLGTMVYTGLLAAGCGRYAEAAAILLAILPARILARRISLT
jgi:4-hydroxybenzoate polyprenyltransferase